MGNAAGLQVIQLTLVKTEAAVAHEKQGTTAAASGNTEPASDAFYKANIGRMHAHIHTAMHTCIHIYTYMCSCTHTTRTKDHTHRDTHLHGPPLTSL